MASKTKRQPISKISSPSKGKGSEKSINPEILSANHKIDASEALGPSNSQTKHTNVRSKKTLNEQSDQSLTDITSQVKFSASEHNYYDVSGLKTNLFNASTNIASSASNYADKDSDNYKKYIWYGAAGLGLIGAAVLISDSGGGGSSSTPTPPPPPNPVHNEFNNFFEFCDSSAFLSPTI